MLGDDDDERTREGGTTGKKSKTAHPRASEAGSESRSHERDREPEEGKMVYEESAGELVEVK